MDTSRLKKGFRVFAPKALVLVVDAADASASDLSMLCAELDAYDATLLKRPCCVFANKLELLSPRERQTQLRALARNTAPFTKLSLSLS